MQRSPMLGSMCSLVTDLGDSQPDLLPIIVILGSKLSRRETGSRYTVALTSAAGGRLTVSKYASRRPNLTHI
jgi:hypothetical protein